MPGDGIESIAIGAESIHKQTFQGKANRPENDWIPEMFYWVEQGVFRRKSIASEYPSTRLGAEGSFSREDQATHVFADAKQRLATKTGVYAGLRELEGLQQRWPDLPVAQSAEKMLQEFSAKAERPWEKESSHKKRSIQGVAIHALMHLHWKYRGIKSDVRLQNRAGARKNYMEDYVEMHWSEPWAETPEAAKNLLRYDRKTVALKRRMGGMLAFDCQGQVQELNLSGTKVTAKQLRIVKKQLHGLQSLRALDLSSAVMKESALSEVASLSSLRALNLNHVTISNRALSHLKELYQLQHLGLAFTDVSNLTQLHTFQELRRLNLGGSQVGNSALKRLAYAPNLKNLSLFSSQVTNAGIPHLVNLKSLQFLNLASTKVDDACCKNLAQIQSLNELVLDGTQVTGDGLEALVQLDDLRHLSLEGLQIMDSALGVLGALKKLETLNVTATQVTARGVTKLQSALPKCKVQWKGDKTNYRTSERLRRAVDRFNANEMEVRRFALRQLQRELLGVCLSSGEGLHVRPGYTRCH